MLNFQQSGYINMLQVHFTQSQDIYALYFFLIIRYQYMPQGSIGIYSKI